MGIPTSLLGRLTTWECRLRQIFERAEPYEEQASRIAQAVRQCGAGEDYFPVPLYGCGSVLRVPEFKDCTAGYLANEHGSVTLSAAAYAVIEGAQYQEPYKRGSEEAVAALHAGRRLDPRQPVQTWLSDFPWWGLIPLAGALGFFCR